jgi:hypothetical protein
MKYLDTQTNLLYDTEKMELVFKGKLQCGVTGMGTTCKWKVWKTQYEHQGKSFTVALAYCEKTGTILNHLPDIQEFLGDHYADEKAKKAYDLIFGEPKYVGNPAS